MRPALVVGWLKAGDFSSVGLLLRVEGFRPVVVSMMGSGPCHKTFPWIIRAVEKRSRKKNPLNPRP